MRETSAAYGSCTAFYIENSSIQCLVSKRCRSAAEGAIGETDIPGNTGDTAVTGSAPPVSGEGGAADGNGTCRGAVDSAAYPGFIAGEGSASDVQAGTTVAVNGPAVTFVRLCPGGVVIPCIIADERTVRNSG